MKLKRYLKLTAGAFKGRKLYVPDLGVRPATNLVRESIFSILENIVESGVKNRSVLDLFAGTGSLGLEALSRGAKWATFVDNNETSINSIRKNLDLLDLKGSVIKIDAASFVRRSKSNLDYDIIFFDPPYKYKKVNELLMLIGLSISVGTKPIVIYERRYQKELPEIGDRYYLLKRRKYGQTEVLYYRLGKNLNL